MIYVRSLVSHRSGEPVVEIEWGKEKGQLDYKSALQLSQQISSAAETAIVEASVVEFLRTEVNLDTEGVSNFLAQIRDARDRVEKGEQKGPVEGS